MELSKSAIQGVAALAIVGVLAAAGFLVVKPQLNQGFDLLSKTSSVNSQTDAEKARIAKLNTVANDGDAVLEDTLKSLQSIPQRQDVTDIAKSVINALNDPTQLTSFKYGSLDSTKLEFKAPPLTLTPSESIDSDLSSGANVGATDTGAPAGDGAETSATGTDTAAGTANNGATASDTAAGTSAGTGTATTDPKTTTPADPNPKADTLSAVPFQIVVTVPTDQIPEFLDKLQKQDRLIHVISATNDQTAGSPGTTGAAATSDKVQTTIFAYAFAQSDANVDAFVKDLNSASKANK